MIKIFIIFTLINLSIQSLDVRVIDGNIAQAHSRPYQVGLRVWRGSYWWQTLQVCGASLLSKKFVLTSGFCVHDSHTTEVILGAHELFKNEATQQRFKLTLSDYIYHPNFWIGSMTNDLALLRLPTDANFNENVQPIALPSKDLMGKSFFGEKIEVAGWGRYDDWSQSFSSVLRYSSNSVTKISVCASQPMFRPLVHDETMCIESFSTLSSPCRGDHGSPVTWKPDKSKPSVIIAVYSFGVWWWNFGCAPSGLSIYAYMNTDIRPYVGWIQGIINS